MPVVDLGKGKLDYEIAGQGRDLVLLHTLLADRTVYDAVVPALAETRRVITPNFPGYGGSTGELGEGIEGYADWVAQVLDQLEVSRDADLLANGFGGFVATSFVLRHPGRVANLMLVDTAAAFPEAAKEPLRILQRNVREGGMARVLDAAMLRMFPKSYIERRPDVIETRKSALSKADPELFAKAAGALVALDHRPRLGEIRHKTLVMVGHEDQTTPPPLSRELAAGIPGAELVELPGVGHCPQLQEPDAFLAHVKRFLAAS